MVPEEQKRKKLNFEKLEKGDKKEITALIKLIYPYLIIQTKKYGNLISQSSLKIEAEDIAQETIEYILSQLPKIVSNVIDKSKEFKISPTVYLLRYIRLISRNKTIDHMKRANVDRKYFPTIESISKETIQLSDVDNFPSQLLSTQNQLENREYLDLINKNMELLPPQDRCALLMRLDGKTYNEIAEILGIPINTLRVKIYRSMNKISESLKTELKHEQ